MVKFAAGILCLCVAMAVPPSLGRKDRIVDVDTLVKEINNDPKSSWKADNYGMNEFNADNFARSRLGARLPPLASAQAEFESKRVPPIQRPADQVELPQHFTWTDSKKTNCPISHIRDQSNCGSCWAVSTAAAFGDRICIQSKGKIKFNISAEYITSCDKKNYGCDGGYMELVHEFLKGGVITGGDYESDVGCQPYSIRPCGYGFYGTKLPCTYDSALTPKCRSNKCTNDWYGSKHETAKNTFRAKSWKSIKGDAYTTAEYNIRKDLYENGPLTLGFYVYDDFRFYKSGIYIPKSGQRILGGHAVRLVGWGVENDVKYWLIANSWTTNWGEKGFFRIIRERNACQIESMATSAMPDL